MSTFVGLGKQSGWQKILDRALDNIQTDRQHSLFNNIDSGNKTLETGYFARHVGFIEPGTPWVKGAVPSVNICERICPTA